VSGDGLPDVVAVEYPYFGVYVNGNQNSGDAWTYYSSLPISNSYLGVGGVIVKDINGDKSNEIMINDNLSMTIYAVCINMTNGPGCNGTFNSTSSSQNSSTSSSQNSDFPSTSSSQNSDFPSTSSSQASEIPSTSSSQNTDYDLDSTTSFSTSTSSSQASEIPSTSSSQNTDLDSTTSISTSGSGLILTTTFSQTPTTNSSQTPTSSSKISDSSLTQIIGFSIGFGILGVIIIVLLILLIIYMKKRMKPQIGTAKISTLKGFEYETNIVELDLGADSND